MQNFSFYSPASLEDALIYLSDHAETCKIIAGGTDLIPNLRDEKLHPRHMLNVLELEELGGISEIENTIRIGPTTTFAELIETALINRFLPLLVKSSSQVGGPQIRNRGTIGGNICTGSPAADVLPAVIALDGELELRSKKNGTRRIAASEAVQAPYNPNLGPDELLTGIFIHKLKPGTRCAYEKVATRNAMARAFMNLSIVLQRDEEGVISDVRIVPGAMMAFARRITVAEEVLAGKKPDEFLIAKAAETLLGDLKGVWIPDYKIPVFRNIFKRLLGELLSESCRNKERVYAD